VAKLDKGLSGSNADIGKQEKESNVKNKTRAKKDQEDEDNC
jgi:hypothetical protein